MPLKNHLLGLLILLIFAGCETFTGIRPNITIGAPKIYSDDQVMKTMAERRVALRDLEKSLQGKELQEIRNVREVSRNSVQLTGQATTDPLVAAPSAIANTDLTLPSSPLANDKLGLSFQSVLHQAVTRDQLLSGLQLLYLGDMDVQSDQRRLVLFRFDVSINRYIQGERFAELAFEINARRSDNTLTPVRVYALAPDYSSIVSQDSRVALDIDSFAAQAAGKTGNTSLQGALLHQKSLEEGLLAVFEQPLEFAVYDSNPNIFGFSFGPRRHIEKRSWMDPRRIFGNTYQIDYVIEPGPRDVYAFVTVPCDAKDLEVKVVLPEEWVLRGKEQHQSLRRLKSIKKEGTHQTKASYSLNSDLNELALPEIREAQISSKLDLPDYFEYLFKLDGSFCSKPTIENNASLGIFPPKIFPKTINTILLTAARPISSETEVFVNHVSIPREQIKVIGRYQLKVTITPKDGLVDLLKAKVATVPVRLLTPTGNENINGNVSLADSESPDPKFMIAPAGGVAGQDVKLTAENALVDLRQVQSVLVGGEVASLIADQQKEGSVMFRIPKPTNDIMEHAVSIDLVFANGQPKVYIPSAFTYNAKK